MTPQLYLQLVRDGNAPAGESSFYFTFTGPAMYTEAKKFQKIDFKDIDKGKADYQTQRQRRLDRDGAALLRVGLVDRRRRAREYVASKVGDNLYAVAMMVKLGDARPRRDA